MTLTVQESIDALDALFGVREPIPAEPLVRLHNTERLDELIAAIAEHMKLPVKFKVSVVSKDTRFRSHLLARTDRSGRGIEGIEAQVTIPSNLPLFGSADLRRFQIGVLLSPAFRTAAPETAITILAHELSHILLHSLRHPERDSEVFTDLVPIVLGFIEIVERGRTDTSVAYEAGATRITATTYGYLSDVDFSFALDRVRSLLRERESRRVQLLNLATWLKLTAARSRRGLARFAKLKHHLDARTGQVRRADATRIVAMHAALASEESDPRRAPRPCDRCRHARSVRIVRMVGMVM